MTRSSFSGLHDDPGRHLEVTSRPSTTRWSWCATFVASLCEHHLVLPGPGHVAYIPNEDGRSTGLSKLPAWSTARPPAPGARADDDGIADAIARPFRRAAVLVVIEAGTCAMS